MHKELGIRTIMALGIAIIFWASAFSGIRAALEDFSPGPMALFRFGVASLVLLAIVLLRGMPLLAKKDVPFFLVLGFLGISVYHVALNYGEITVTAGSASLLIGSAPIFTVILAKIFLKEKLSLRGWVGIIVSFGGIALISLGEGEGYAIDAGALLILLAAICVSIFFVFQKFLHNRYSPFQITTYSIWAGTMFLLVFLPGLIDEMANASSANILTVVYLGVFPAALAYMVWNYALSKVPASILASVLNITPVLAIFIGWVWLDEVPTMLAIVGGVAAITGVVIVNRYGMRRAKESLNSDIATLE
ncbi:MAG: EamA family transporter [Chloroflexi bacterium]|nr:EamA family transporter [Chloroflexota bacterium]